MQKKDCFLFGTIFKLHGYKGEVKIYNDQNIVLDPSSVRYLFVDNDGELVPYFIERIRLTNGNIILVKFEDVNSQEDAKKIKKYKVYLPENATIENKKKQETLIDYSVIDLKLGDIGRISRISLQTQQSLIYVRNKEKEFCFPMHEEFVKKVDDKNKIMEVVIPKELLDLN